VQAPGFTLHEHIPCFRGTIGTAIGASKARWIWPGAEPRILVRQDNKSWRVHVQPAPDNMAGEPGQKEGFASRTTGSKC